MIFPGEQQPVDLVSNSKEMEDASKKVIILREKLLKVIFGVES